MWSCTAPACDNDLRKKKFFAFPADENRRKLWSVKCGLSSVLHNAKICEDHFEKNQFLLGQDVKKLKSDAVPTLFTDSVTKPTSEEMKSGINEVNPQKYLTKEISKSAAIPPLFSSPVKVQTGKKNKQLEDQSFSKKKTEHILESPPDLTDAIKTEEPEENKNNFVPQSSVLTNLEISTKKNSRNELLSIEQSVKYGKPGKSHKSFENNILSPQSNSSQVASELQTQAKCGQLPGNNNAKLAKSKKAYVPNSLPALTLPCEKSPVEVTKQLQSDLSVAVGASKNQSNSDPEARVTNDPVSPCVMTVMTNNITFIAEKTSDPNEILVREITQPTKKSILLNPRKKVQSAKKAHNQINNKKTNKSKSVNKPTFRCQRKSGKIAQKSGIKQKTFTNIHNQTFEIVDLAEPANLLCFRKSAAVEKKSEPSSRHRKCKMKSRNYMCDLSFNSESNGSAEEIVIQIDSDDSNLEQHSKRKLEGSKSENSSKKSCFGEAYASDEISSDKNRCQSSCSFNMNSEDNSDPVHQKQSDTLLDEMIKLYQSSMRKLKCPNQAFDVLIMPSMPTSNIDDDDDGADLPQLVARMKQWNDVLKTELLSFREKYKNEHKKNELLMENLIHINLENKKLKQEKVKMKNHIRNTEKTICNYQKLVSELELKVSALSKKSCVHLQRLDIPMPLVQKYRPQPSTQTGFDGIKHAKKALQKEKEIEFQKKLLKMLKIKNENKKIDLLIKEFQSEKEIEELRLRINELENENRTMIEENEAMLGEIEQYIKDNKKMSTAFAHQAELNNKMSKQIDSLQTENNLKSKRIWELSETLDKLIEKKGNRESSKQ